MLLFLNQNVSYSKPKHSFCSTTFRASLTLCLSCKNYILQYPFKSFLPHLLQNIICFQILPSAPSLRSTKKCQKKLPHSYLESATPQSLIIRPFEMNTILSSILHYAGLFREKEHESMEQFMLLFLFTRNTTLFQVLTSDTLLFRFFWKE